MAFDKYDVGRKKPQMMSLIDMAFILLLFFLVTSMVAQMTKEEQKLAIPTPENKPGRAQILVQFVDENGFLYLDQTATSIVEQVQNNFGFKSRQWQQQRIVSTLMNDRYFSKTQLLSRLKELKMNASNHPEENYFVLIRCPDEIAYYHVIEIIQAVSGLSNINYGCVGGSIDDIRNADDIALKTERDSQGNKRENLVILFPSDKR